MSGHYSTRQPSGCVGCLVAALMSVGVLTATAYVCYELAVWLVEVAK